MAGLIKGSQQTKLTKEGLSPYKRPVLQKLLETAVRDTIKQLGITREQRDQHRVYRALIRMSARIALFMGYSLSEHLVLVTELYEKCRLEFEAQQKSLPASKVTFQNAVLSSEHLKELLQAETKKLGK
jgi:hypothetical protein